MIIHHYISHTNEETKREMNELWKEIQDHGVLKKAEWQGDYLVATYEYNNKTYELIENMELGINSEIVEII